MTDISTGATATGVVVGVDGTPASINAARYARAEAARLDEPLRIVHVLPDYAPMAIQMVPVAEINEGGRQVLRSVGAALEAAESPASERAVPVKKVLRRGSRVASLVADARAARLLVVGADRRAIAQRLLTGNTSTGVAASSVAPVVSVPETWTPAEHGVVLAGVKRPGRSTDLLAEAFAVARARGARLLVVHAWRLPSEYDDVIASRIAVDEWDARAHAELEAAVADWRASYPDVEVELRVVHDQPAHALVEASAQVDELVLVRRARGFPAAAHLGSTARTVLRQAHCPVRVVPPGHAAEVAGLVLEDAGGMRK
ncbi:MAG TPA: universal stress protein [Nocardioides sp.]|uniref:universal stress protein n=1 Tax=Nocardioides sp. TaxID=35761 RepID=UPI002CAECE85|nr:universal stress protein [Nocardioides sp.]HTW16845.1 universal stress protein [Nocardioides sp.]